MSEPDPPQCTHDKCIPEVDDVALEGLSSHEVRERYPRFMGRCPDCGDSVIAYASFLHYVAGDW